MRVLIGMAHVPFRKRKVDYLAETLRQALVSAGHTADITRIPVSWTSPERVFDALLSCRFLDWTDLTEADEEILLALEFPAYLIQHPHKVLWLTHHWDFPRLLPEGANAEGEVPASTMSEALREVDRRHLPDLAKVLSISATASSQLQRSAHLTATPVYPPPRHMHRFAWSPAENYYLVPPGLSRARLQLLLDAVALSREPARVRICADSEKLASGSDPALAEKLEGRLEWLGPVTDRDLFELYARCRAVVYPALEDTFPCPSFRAMLASKPVITCVDSGAPAEVVDHEKTGLAVAADARELASAMDELSRHPNVARSWGARGRSRIGSLNLDWTRTIKALLS